MRVEADLVRTDRHTDRQTNYCTLASACTRRGLISLADFSGSMYIYINCSHKLILAFSLCIHSCTQSYLLSEKEISIATRYISGTKVITMTTILCHEHKFLSPLRPMHDLLGGESMVAYSGWTGKRKIKVHTIILLNTSTCIS